jgi:hypothetical protein
VGGFGGFLNAQKIFFWVIADFEKESKPNDSPSGEGTED